MVEVRVGELSEHDTANSWKTVLTDRGCRKNGGALTVRSGKHSRVIMDHHPNGELCDGAYRSVHIGNVLRASRRHCGDTQGSQIAVDYLGGASCCLCSETITAEERLR